MLITGALTLMITALAAKDMYGNWVRLTGIQTLKDATALSDQLFDAMERLSIERDVARRAREHLVTNLVTQRVVDLPEAVQVEHQHRRSIAQSSAPLRWRDPRIAEGSQPAERVVRGLVAVLARLRPQPARP